MQTDERIDYCITSFMSKLYLIGGWIKRSGKSVSTCTIYDNNSSTWIKAADLNVARDCAACTVF